MPSNIDIPEQLGLEGYFPFVFEVAGSRVAVTATARVRTVIMDFENILNFGKGVCAERVAVKEHGYSCVY